MKNKKSILLILISALMFGSYGVWARLIGDSFGVFYQGWTRGLIISIILFPILYWKKEIVPIKKEDFKWLGVFLLFTSLTQAPLFYAFNHMDIGTATVLFFVSMLLTMYIIGFSFLKEKLSKIKVIAFLLASVGLYVTFSFSLVAFSLFAASMAILNGVASGGEVSFSKKLTGSYSTLYISWLSWMIVAITNVVMSLALGEVQHLPSFNIVWLYQMGYVVTSIFAFGFVIEGLKHVEASIGGLLGLLEVVFSIIFGIVIFSEQMTLQVGVGALLVLLAAALPHLSSIYQKRL
ncbi:DMT family transporter [Patescibacteria group bacterium]